MDCSPPGSSVHVISRQEYWSGLPFPAPRDLPDPGIKPTSPAWQADSLPLSHPGDLNSYLDDLKNHFRINGRQECLWGLSDMSMMTLHILKDICDLQISLFWVLFPVCLRGFFCTDQSSPHYPSKPKQVHKCKTSGLGEGLSLQLSKAHWLTHACWANECRNRPAMALTFSVTNSHHFKGGDGDYDRWEHTEGR